MDERAQHSTAFKRIVAGAKEALGLPKNTTGLEPIPLPHAQGGFEKFVRANPENPETIGALHSLLMEFYEAEKTNSQIYHTPDGQASFPYTSINITEVAKKLYEQTRGPLDVKTAVDTENQQQEKADDKKPRTEAYYTFGSFLSPRGDAQFTFPEYAIHEYMRRLPSIWKTLEEGRTPDTYIHYTLGSPTSLFGTISQEAVDEMQKDPYAKFGKWYSDFIRSQPPADLVRFHGNSMGANFEVSTAQSLIEENNKKTNNPKGTQKDLPYRLDILLDVPAGIHKPWNWLQRRQTRFGFLVDGTMAIMTRPDLRASFSQNAFLAKIAPELEANDYQIQIPEDNKEPKIAALKPVLGALKGLEEPIRMTFDTIIGLSDPELIRKLQAIKMLKDQIKHGVDFDFQGNGVFARIRRGTLDLTTPSLSFYQNAKEKREEAASRTRTIYPRPGKPGYTRVSDRLNEPNPIGRDIIKSEDPNVSTFAIRMNHIIPYFRESELRRWNRTSDHFLALQQKGNAQTEPVKP